MEDKLIFSDEPLQEIAKRFEKWYNVTILIQNDTLKDEKFTAVFQGENIDAALTALQITYPFKFHKNKNGDIVIEK
nr:DUF4974 domain-containing protein [Niabella ginsengisoli]